MTPSGSPVNQSYVLYLLRQGLTADTIHERLGICKASVYKIAKKAGIALPKDILGKKIT